MLERPNPVWWPTDYCDEVMPAGRADPDAWIVVRPGGAIGSAWMIASDFDEPPVWSLADGAIVSFVSREIHDEIKLTLTADGCRFERAPPAGFEQCCILLGFQAQTLAEGVDEMIARLRACEVDPGEFLASFYTFGAPICRRPADSRSASAAKSVSLAGRRPARRGSTRAFRGAARVRGSLFCQPSAASA